MSICLIERLFYPFLLLTVVMVLISIYSYIRLDENVIFYTTLLQETYHIEFPWQKLYLWIRCKYVKQVLPLIKVWWYHADYIRCPQNCQWGSEPKMFLALCPASSAGHQKMLWNKEIIQWSHFSAGIVWFWTHGFFQPLQSLVAVSSMF